MDVTFFFKKNVCLAIRRYQVVVQDDSTHLLTVVFETVLPYQVEVCCKLGLVLVFPGFGIA